MYVCVCRAVTERQIEQVVRESGVRSLRGLRQTLGVAGQCGRCGNCAREVLQAALPQANTTATMPSLEA
jgi:bacterioferritin-associated ferredoxin